MPRKIQRPDEMVTQRSSSQLAERLAEELRANRDFGQPWIDEQRLKNGLVRVSVLWDRWAGVDDEGRTIAILDAYRNVEGENFTKTIALATGYTIPEAVAAGILPFQIITARRRDDPVTMEQLRDAMMDQGGSILLNPQRPQLRFATLTDAEACLGRLVERLPESDQIWQVTQDVGQILDLSWAVDD